MSIKEALATNILLKQKLDRLRGNEATLSNKQSGKMRAIELQHNLLKLQQKMERQDQQMRRLAEEQSAARTEIRKVQKDIEDALHQDKASWEQIGFGTIAYKDGFPTGLNKRTPTGGHFTS